MLNERYASNEGPKEGSKKDQERYEVVIAWLRTRISFEILRAVHVGVRGTGSPFHRKQFEVVDDFSLNVEAA